MWKLLRKIRRLFVKDPEKEFWKNREKVLNPRGLQKYFKPVYVHRGQKILDKKNAFIPMDRDIHPFVTPHGLSGIFIAANAAVGEGCTIFHQVTIGSNTFKDSKGFGAPKIGDRVYIGAGAKIIGGITIGNDVRIGANAVVSRDVPDNATVVCAEPRVIVHDTPRDNTFTAWRDV